MEKQEYVGISGYLRNGKFGDFVTSQTFDIDVIMKDVGNIVDFIISDSKYKDEPAKDGKKQPSHFIKIKKGNETYLGSKSYNGQDSYITRARKIKGKYGEFIGSTPVDLNKVKADIGTTVFNLLIAKSKDEYQEEGKPEQWYIKIIPSDPKYLPKGTKASTTESPTSIGKDFVDDEIPF